jgi:hypothetical protein
VGSSWERRRLLPNDYFVQKLNELGRRPQTVDGSHQAQLETTRHVIAPKIDAGEEARRLAAFLDSHDIPEDEKRRWRV